MLEISKFHNLEIHKLKNYTNNLEFLIQEN